MLSFFGTKPKTNTNTEQPQTSQSPSTTTTASTVVTDALNEAANNPVTFNATEPPSNTAKSLPQSESPPTPGSSANKNAVPPPPTESQDHNKPLKQTPQSPSTFRRIVDATRGKACGCDLVHVIATICMVTSAVIAIFACLCLNNVFPPPFLGGMIGCACAAIGGFLLVLACGAIIYLRYREHSQKPV